MSGRDLDDLRRFATSVDWRAAARNKEQYWCNWKRKHGPGAAIQMADELRRQAVAQRPGWPGEAERREDLEAHLRQLEAFERFDAWRRAAAG